MRYGLELFLFTFFRLTLVEQFTDATYQLFTGHFKGKDVTTEVMQKLTQRPKVKGSYTTG